MDSKSKNYLFLVVNWPLAMLYTVALICIGLVSSATWSSKLGFVSFFVMVATIPVTTSVMCPIHLVLHLVYGIVEYKANKKATTVLLTVASLLFCWGIVIAGMILSIRLCDVPAL